MKCPECKKEMIMLLGQHNYHLTGMRGDGTCYFRTFDLYKCVNCGEYFHVEGEPNIIWSRSLKLWDRKI